MEDDLSGSPVFIDWSGDPALPVQPPRTTYLVFAVAVVDDYPWKNELFARLRTSLSVAKDTQFHYSRSAPSTKAAFFTYLRSVPFACYVLYVDKTRLPVSYNRRDQFSLYNEFMRYLAERIPTATFANSVAVVDGKKDKKIVRCLQDAVKETMRGRNAADGLVKAIGRHARIEDGLQIADMVAGAVRDHPTIRDRYLRPLRGAVVMHSFT